MPNDFFLIISEEINAAQGNANEKSARYLQLKCFSIYIEYKFVHVLTVF